MEQVQGKIKDLEAERAALNPQLADDRFRLTQIDQQLEDLREQIVAATEQADQDKVHEEVQSIVLEHDFSAALGHPDANKIIYTLMYETRIGHLKELRAKMDELAAAQAAHAEEKVMLEAAVETAKEEAAQAKEARQDLADKLAGIIAERDKLEEDNRLLLGETRGLRNEVTRLDSRVRELTAQLEMERKRSASFIPSSSESLGAMLAEAAKTTKQKRMVKNLEPLDGRKSMYKATAEDGSEVRIGWLDLNQYEVVDEFPPAPPAGDMVADKPVTEGELAEAEREVVAAAEEAARFSDVVSGDSAGCSAQDGAEAALGADDAVPAAEAPKPSLEERVAVLEAQMADVAREFKSMGILINIEA